MILNFNHSDSEWDMGENKKHKNTGRSNDQSDSSLKSNHKTLTENESSEET